MEILTTATVEGKILNLEQTISFTENKFITIKELFSINGEVFVALLNQDLPHTLQIHGVNIVTNRWIMSAKQFVVMYNNKL